MTDRDTKHDPTSKHDPLGWGQPVQDFLAHAHGSLAKGTEAFYRQRLSVLTGWAHERAEDGQGVALTDFKARHLRLYLAFRTDWTNPLTKRPISEATRRHDAVCARVFFRWCAREGYLPVDPLAGFAVPRAAKPFVAVPTDEHCQAILRAAKERWMPQRNPNMLYVPERRRRFFASRNYALLAGLVATGARVGELLALTLEDFQPGDGDGLTGRIAIRTAKGKEPRFVPIGADWERAVCDYLKHRPKASPSPCLFVTDEGRPMTPLLMRQQYYKDLGFAGVPHYTLHSLRHYCLTRLAEVSVFGAQAVAGHKDLRVTRGYLHTSEAHTRETMEKADPLGRLLGPVTSAGSKRRRLV